jgi:hypothetical protein|eukprot:SAG31_NODE_355_length_17187_cov_15.601299_29_plen_131_part_00
MKKLTTNQLLMAGGVIALIYILYKKKKAKNGSEMIQDALSNSSTTVQADDSEPVSVSDGDKGTSEPPKGGQKSCKQAMAEFKKIAMTSRMSKEALNKLQKEMLKGCIGYMPMPSKPIKFDFPPMRVDNLM